MVDTDIASSCAPITLRTFTLSKSQITLYHSTRTVRYIDQMRILMTVYESPRVITDPNEATSPVDAQRLHFPLTSSLKGCTLHIVIDKRFSFKEQSLITNKREKEIIQRTRECDLLQRGVAQNLRIYNYREGERNLRNFSFIPRDILQQ